MNDYQKGFKAGFEQARKLDGYPNIKLCVVCNQRGKEFDDRRIACVDCWTPEWQQNLERETAEFLGARA